MDVFVAGDRVCLWMSVCVCVSGDRVRICKCLCYRGKSVYMYVCVLKVIKCVYVCLCVPL